MSKASDDVLAERERQVKVEGWTETHDDQWQFNELSKAAASYAYYPEGDIPLFLWPWDQVWFKPVSHRQNCVKAAALLIAEIERIDRYESKIKNQGQN